MSKEMGALSRLEDLFNHSDFQENIHNIDWLLTISDDFKDIKKALTPPTEEAVCKALSKWLGEKVVYIKDNYNHGFAIHNGAYIVKFEDRTLRYVNPTIFTTIPIEYHNIIGRFYEGLENE